MLAPNLVDDHVRCRSGPDGRVDPCVVHSEVVKMRRESLHLVRGSIMGQGGHTVDPPTSGVKHV